MTFILITLSLICIFLFINSLLIKKEVRSITAQLEEHNNFTTNKKIDVSLFNKEIEDLAYSINRHIDINIESQIKQRYAEDELKKVIANISHDLRTPLTSILGYVQMIKSKKLSKEVQIEYLETAELRAKYLQTLLNDFFQLSIVESPEYKIELDNVNLNNILCEVIGSSYYNFKERNITPEIKIPDDPIMAIGNSAAIKRVMENLIINIIKHSEKEVTIILKKEKDKAVLSTINTAKNINQKDINLIFNRFYKADTSRSTKNGSTGLGLSIAKGLMEKMNGNIYAEVDRDLLYIFCEWKI